AVTGAAIGFFVGLVGEAFKQAWVKVLIGRNEGREHILDSPISVIGRDELADIPIFLDRYLAPRQASIRFQNNRYYLFDEAGRPQGHAAAGPGGDSAGAVDGGRPDPGGKGEPGLLREGDRRARGAPLRGAARTGGDPDSRRRRLRVLRRGARSGDRRLRLLGA